MSLSHESMYQVKAKVSKYSCYKRFNSCQQQIMLQTITFLFTNNGWWTNTVAELILKLQKVAIHNSLKRCQNYFYQMHNAGQCFNKLFRHIYNLLTYNIKQCDAQFIKQTNFKISILFQHYYRNYSQAISVKIHKKT